MWQKVSSIYRKSLSSYGQQQKKQINRKLSKRFVYISDEIHSLLFSFHNFVVVLLVICCCCCCQHKKQEKKKTEKKKKIFCNDVRVLFICAECRTMDHHQTNSATRTLGRFGDYLCESPWSLLESATQAMKSRQGDNVEFVLWTG